MPSELKIGTRGSQLALFQANWVKDRLSEAHPGLNVTLIKIKTTGDKIQDVPLAKIGGKGLFVKEIEESLLQKRIDLAVHSIKDVPTEFPRGSPSLCDHKERGPSRCLHLKGWEDIERASSRSKDRHEQLEAAGAIAPFQKRLGADSSERKFRYPAEEAKDDEPRRNRAGPRRGEKTRP